MKKFLILALLVPTIALAEEPTTECPGSMQALSAPEITWSTSKTYDQGWIPLGTGTLGFEGQSCLEISSNLVSYAVACPMYALAETEYSDDTGAYNFIDVCPLE
ncbi:MAG: hypothetical protein IKB05_02800 [Alphaproteobacteria bacterium]|nr:hypothetical protein [Alphaproteobacteria bacterium]